MSPNLRAEQDALLDPGLDAPPRRRRRIGFSGRRLPCRRLRAKARERHPRRLTMSGQTHGAQRLDFRRQRHERPPTSTSALRLLRGFRIFFRDASRGGTIDRR